MQALWQDITAWFKKHDPNCYKNIMRVKNGADEAELAIFETTLGYSLPEDFKAYLRLYNASYRVAFFEYESLNISSMLHRRAGLNKQLNEGVFRYHEVFKGLTKIYPTKWHSAWLPFAQDGCGNLLCLDFAPTKCGHYGQVFYWKTRGGPGEPEIASFLEFVTDYRNGLFSGKYTT